MRYVEITEPFNTEYPTWIIAFCPDTAEFFVTNQRHFFWESEQNFESEEEGIKWFEEHVGYFIDVNNKIMNDMFVHPTWNQNRKVWLDNTNKFYTDESGI